jgi:hypothetical protein
MPGEIIGGYTKSLQSQKEIAEQAFKQLDNNGIHWRPVNNANTIAILVKHLAGHLRSRFADFFMVDGERPDRNKAAEFADERISPDELREIWDKSWIIVFSALNDMVDRDLNRKKILGGEEINVADYLPRVLSHTAYHTGQIVLLAKLYLGENWKKIV